MFLNRLSDTTVYHTAPDRTVNKGTISTGEGGGGCCCQYYCIVDVFLGNDAETRD